MLVLRADNPPAIDVPLGHGAAVRVRPATVMEVERAKAEVASLTVGLIAGADPAATASALLGEEFHDADFAKIEWLTAAAERLSVLKLAVKCCESWSGIVGEDEEPLPLNEANLALLLRDPAITHKVSLAIEAGVHKVVQKKTDRPPRRLAGRRRTILLCGMPTIGRALRLRPDRRRRPALSRNRLRSSNRRRPRGRCRARSPRRVAAGRHRRHRDGP